MTNQDDSIGQDPYAAEAKERWGNTDAYRQSQERVKKMTKADMDAVKAAGDALMQRIALVADKDPADPAVQALIAEHYKGLRTFYEPNMEIYRGLARMYVDDPRFTAYYEKYRPDLAVFMHDAMMAYCNAQEQ